MAYGNSVARDLAIWLTVLPQGLQPSEVGTPRTDLSGRRGFFSDSAHLDHLHLGFRANH